MDPNAITPLSPEQQARRRRIQPIRVRVVSNSMASQPRADAISTGSGLGTARSQETSTMIKATADKAPSSDGGPEVLNNDHCETCGGIGRFVCCDNCPRSFHFACAEPPMDVNQLPEGQWFCRVCAYQKNPPPKMPKSLFRELLDNLDKTNPSIFSLPQDIKDYYKGVGSNVEGGYLNVRDVKPIKFGRNGFIEEADLRRLKDKYGNTILCYKCGRSSFKGRIVSCDHCNLHWHMDCLSPPMTAAPAATRRWMCPNHAEHDMSKKRRPKNTIVVDGKGRRNDGDIDIINEKTLFDPTARQQHIESEDLVFNNVRYRIPEKSIKLDFIDRIHSGHKRKAEEAFEFDSSLSPAPSSLPSTSKDMDDIPAAESASTDYARRKSDQLWLERGERDMVRELQRRAQVLGFLDPASLKEPGIDRLSVLVQAAMIVEDGEHLHTTTDSSDSWMSFPDNLEAYLPTKSDVKASFDAPLHSDVIHIPPPTTSSGSTPPRSVTDPASSQTSPANSTRNPVTIIASSSNPHLRLKVPSNESKEHRPSRSTRSRKSSPAHENGTNGSLAVGHQLLNNLSQDELKQLVAIRELLTLKDPQQLLHFLRER